MLGLSLLNLTFDNAGRLTTEAGTDTTGAGGSEGDAPLPAWALWLLGAGLLGGMNRRSGAGSGSRLRGLGVVILTAMMMTGLSASISTPTQAADLSLQYDANGNVSKKTTPSGSTTYTYDALDRIDTENGPAGNRNHDFDANDNRITDGAGTVTTITPNSDRIATINGINVTLDAVGNVTNDGTYRYAWDALNQLRELRTTSNALIATYYYDYRGLRTRKVTTAVAPQGAGTTFYHYDQDGHLLAETAPGQVPVMTYIWNRDSLTGVIVHQPQRTVYTVQTDQLGSPFQIRTLEGKVMWRWEPEAFGKTLPNEDSDGDGQKLTLNLRFPGQYYDQESGLHYNWHRYYSPKLARYLSPDPIGLAGGSNRFSYVSGNPLGRSDPTGESELVLGAAAVGGLVLLSSPVTQQAARDAVSATINAAKKLCGSDDNDNECEKRRERDEAACALLSGTRYKSRGLGVCMRSAAERYAECLRFGPSGIKTPLHGVDTPL